VLEQDDRLCVTNVAAFNHLHRVGKRNFQDLNVLSFFELAAADGNLI
jgi:hypothetical protein